MYFVAAGFGLRVGFWVMGPGSIVSPGLFLRVMLMGAM